MPTDPDAPAEQGTEAPPADDSVTDGAPAGRAGVLGRVDRTRDRAQRTLAWQVWDRMLEIEFVDRSVALAGKAFVSFFPLVIVVAAFLPTTLRDSVLTALTSRIGVGGSSLATVKEAFASTDDIRRATSFLGLLLTVFFATSFTTALQRVYLRAWRRTPAGKLGAYKRGPAWLAVMIGYMAVLGFLRAGLGDGIGLGVFLVLSVTSSAAMWWFTAWFLLEGQVRGRVLVPTALITGLAMSVYALSATVWMPGIVSRNESQFGFFGVALALVTWFSGAATCILAGAAAGPVLAEDDGWIGRLVRGASADLLVEGAAPSLPAPTTAPRLRDAFKAVDEDLR